MGKHYFPHHHRSKYEVHDFSKEEIKALGEDFLPLAIAQTYNALLSEVNPDLRAEFSVHQSYRTDTMQTQGEPFVRLNGHSKSVGLKNNADGYNTDFIGTIADKIVEDPNSDCGYRVYAFRPHPITGRAEMVDITDEFNDKLTEMETTLEDRAVAQAEYNQSLEKMVWEDYGKGESFKVLDAKEYCRKHDNDITAMYELGLEYKELYEATHPNSTVKIALGQSQSLELFNHPQVIICAYDENGEVEKTVELQDKGLIKDNVWRKDEESHYRIVMDYCGDSEKDFFNEIQYMKGQKYIIDREESIDISIGNFKDATDFEKAFEVDTFGTSNPKDLEQMMDDLSVADSRMDREPLSARACAKVNGFGMVDIEKLGRINEISYIGEDYAKEISNKRGIEIENTKASYIVDFERKDGEIYSVFLYDSNVSMVKDGELKTVELNGRPFVALDDTGVDITDKMLDVVTKANIVGKDIYRQNNKGERVFDEEKLAKGEKPPRDKGSER